MQRIKDNLPLVIGVILCLYLLINGVYFYRLGGFEGNYPLSTALGHLVFALVCLLIFLWVYLRQKFKSLKRLIVLAKRNKVQKLPENPVKLVKKRHTL